MATVKSLRSGTTPPKEAGESVCTPAAKAIAWKRDNEGRMYVNCGPSYYEEGKTKESRYHG